MALPIFFLGTRTLFDPATNPARPQWAPADVTVERLTELPARDFSDCLLVADIRRRATAAVMEKYGSWVSWEILRLHARVDKSNGAVWVLLSKVMRDEAVDKVEVEKRWLYFEEFVANYPKAAQVLKPVDEACYKPVVWEDWMEDDYEAYQLQGVPEDDTELVGWLGDLGHRKKVLEQGTVRVRWQELFG